jgi:hypothetical protein
MQRPGVNLKLLSNKALFIEKRSKDIDFTRFSYFLFLKFKFEPGLSTYDHVPAPDWLVPLCADQGFRPSDLKGSRRLRSEHTSLS